MKMGVNGINNVVHRPPDMGIMKRYDTLMKKDVILINKRVYMQHKETNFKYLNMLMKMDAL